MGGVGSTKSTFFRDLAHTEAELSLRPTILVSSTYTDENNWFCDGSTDIPNVSHVLNVLASICPAVVVPIIIWLEDVQMDFDPTEPLDHRICPNELDDDNEGALTKLGGGGGFRRRKC